jgi:hypothetical protein
MTNNFVILAPKINLTASTDLTVLIVFTTRPHWKDDLFATKYYILTSGHNNVIFCFVFHYTRLIT